MQSLSIQHISHNSLVPLSMWELVHTSQCSEFVCCAMFCIILNNVNYLLCPHQSTFYWTSRILLYMLALLNLKTLNLKLKLEKNVFVLHISAVLYSHSSVFSFVLNVYSRPMERTGWWLETRTMEKAPAESTPHWSHDTLEDEPSLLRALQESMASVRGSLIRIKC